jgi:hypothetical protein
MDENNNKSKMNENSTNYWFSFSPQVHQFLTKNGEALTIYRKLTFLYNSIHLIHRDNHCLHLNVEWEREKRKIIIENVYQALRSNVN